MIWQWGKLQINKISFWKLKILRFNLYLKTTSLKLSVTYLKKSMHLKLPPCKHYQKTFEIAIVKNLKIFSINAYENKFPGLIKKRNHLQFCSSKENYRPISTLFNFMRSSKVYFSYNQITIWKASSQNISQVSKKFRIRSIYF